MLTNAADNLIELTDCSSEIATVIESCNVENVFVLGGFNAHPGTRYANELNTFWIDLLWACADMELLTSDTHTYTRIANGSLRWLDHCVVSSAARK